MVCLIYTYTLSPQALGVYIRQTTPAHVTTVYHNYSAQMAKN